MILEGVYEEQQVWYLKGVWTANLRLFDVFKIKYKSTNLANLLA